MLLTGKSVFLMTTTQNSSCEGAFHVCGTHVSACMPRVGIALKVHGVAGDDEARNRGTQKSVLERQAPATFPVVIEMRERAFWVTHWTEDSVDCVLHGKDPTVQVGIIFCTNGRLRAAQDIRSSLSSRPEGG